MSRTWISAKEIVMRYTPAALALSLLAAVTASVSYSAPHEELDALATALLAEGNADLAAGRVNEAVGAYEAALVRKPGSVTVLLRLAEATRANGLQGQALRYYRDALETDPRNLMAIAGEGAALAEKGAVERARRNLARLESICGTDCEATRQLASVIARGPVQRVLTAEAVAPELDVSEN
jgi:tetratricopeptide (TPR) repeat protein